MVPYVTRSSSCMKRSAPQYVPQPHLTPNLTLHLLKLPTNATTRISSLLTNTAARRRDLRRPHPDRKRPERAIRLIRHNFAIIVADPRGVDVNHPVRCDPKYGAPGPRFYSRTEGEYEEALEFYRELGESFLERTGR